MFVAVTVNRKGTSFLGYRIHNGYNKLVTAVINSVAQKAGLFAIMSHHDKHTSLLHNLAIVSILCFIVQGTHFTIVNNYVLQ